MGCPAGRVSHRVSACFRNGPGAPQRRCVHGAGPVGCGSVWRRGRAGEGMMRSSSGDSSPSSQGSAGDGVGWGCLRPRPGGRAELCRRRPLAASDRRCLQRAVRVRGAGSRQPTRRAARRSTRTAGAADRWRRSPRRGSPYHEDLGPTSFVSHDHLRRNLAEGALIARARKRCLRDDGSGEGRMGPFSVVRTVPRACPRSRLEITEDISRTGFQARVVFGDRIVRAGRDRPGAGFAS